DLDEILLLARQALETTRLRREVRAIRGNQRREFGFDAIIGGSPAMQRIKALLARIASSPATTVLLTGETGTGKDLAAKAIHYNSERATHPFVNVTCSALPEQLLESELFGHERGAFTDARQQTRGLFETADGGTLLRERKGDVPLLASFFIDHYNREFRRHNRGLTPAAIAILEQHSWPGNIRELRNTIERAMLLAGGDSIEKDDLVLTRATTVTNE